jgi:hypothetical protein
MDLTQAVRGPATDQALAAGDQRSCRDTAERVEGAGRFAGGNIAYVDQGLVGLIAIIGQMQMRAHAMIHERAPEARMLVKFMITPHSSSRLSFTGDSVARSDAADLRVHRQREL